MAIISQKQVNLFGRNYVIAGNLADRYFREAVPNNGTLNDAPACIAAQFLAKDGVAVDVGANIGLSTLAFAEIARDGLVIAFEPSRASFELLVANIRNNARSNVTPIMAAVSDCVGTVRFAEDPQFMAGNRVASSAADGPLTSLVRATTLDYELSSLDLQRLDLLKIDVEGHERKVLSGATQVLKTFEPICIVEFNSYVLVYREGVSPVDFLNYLQDLFPYVYRFARPRHRIARRHYMLVDIRQKEDEFLKINAASGFVDDLVCAFSPLPATR